MKSAILSLVLVFLFSNTSAQAFEPAVVLTHPDKVTFTRVAHGYWKNAFTGKNQLNLFVEGVYVGRTCASVPPEMIQHCVNRLVDLLTEARRQGVMVMIDTNQINTLPRLTNLRLADVSSRHSLFNIKLR